MSSMNSRDAASVDVIELAAVKADTEAIRSKHFESSIIERVNASS